MNGLTADKGAGKLANEIRAIRKSREGLMHEIADRQFILTAAGALLFAIFSNLWGDSWILTVSMCVKALLVFAMALLVAGFLSLLISVNRLAEMRSIYFLIELEFEGNPKIIQKNSGAIDAFKIQKWANRLFYILYFIGIVILSLMYFLRIIFS